MQIQQGLTKEDFLEELEYHSCPDCNGTGEVMAFYDFDSYEVITCPNDCDNGFVENL